MPESYYEALDAFENTIKAIASEYYLEDCQAKIEAAVETLVVKGRDLDTEIEDLKSKNRDLENQLVEKEILLSDFKNSCVIKVKNLQLREKLEHFITTELYPYHNDKQDWEFT